MQVWQGYSHEEHTWEIEIVPIGQSERQVFPDNEKFLHEVQLVTVPWHVRQSPSQGTASPEIFI